MATLIDGKEIAARVREDVGLRSQRLAASGTPAGLAVIQVGVDPASSVYVRNKRRTCEALGIASFAYDLPEDTSQTAVLSLIDELNVNPSVHGILVQLPLPGHILPASVIERIAPDKDVDGFHPQNAGRLLIGQPGFVPCTPAGVMRLLQAYPIDIAGQHAVVIGRSNIVGKPVSLLLQRANATVTMAHSRTRDLAGLCRQADILVVAVGRAEMVRGDWVKPGAAVVDVGIQRGADGRLVGDVAFAEVEPIAGHITPVPGGVGPMTIALLMHNTVLSAERAGDHSP